LRGDIDINNVGFISQALFARGDPDYDQVEAATWQAAQVSTISIMNFAGRFLIGFIADGVKSRLRYPRSFCIAFVACFYILSQAVVLGTIDVRNLWRGSALLGLAYGALIGLLPSICIEWFGLGKFLPSRPLFTARRMLTYRPQRTFRRTGAMCRSRPLSVGISSRSLLDISLTGVTRTSPWRQGNQRVRQRRSRQTRSCCRGSTSVSTGASATFRRCT